MSNWQDINKLFDIIKEERFDEPLYVPDDLFIAAITYVAQDIVIKKECSAKIYFDNEMKPSLKLVFNGWAIEVKPERFQKKTEEAKAIYDAFVDAGDKILHEASQKKASNIFKCNVWAIFDHDSTILAICSLDAPKSLLNGFKNNGATQGYSVMKYSMEDLEKFGQT